MTERALSCCAMKKVLGKRVAAKAKKVSPKITKTRLAKSGVTTRIRGHVLLRGKRAQARRDALQSKARGAA